MREILFQGRRLDNGEWVEGWYEPFEWIGEEVYKANIVYRIKDTASGDEWLDDAEVDPTTVGQYTGLNDKNGKRIFERHICKFRNRCGSDMCWIGVVRYERQQFVLSGGPNNECPCYFTLPLSQFVPEDIEIIGIIPDNSDLLYGDNSDG